MNKTRPQWIAIAITIITIGINAAANIIPFNGITTAQVSEKFSSYFVPEGYVFAIWGLIYLLLLVFAFGYSVVPKKEREYVREIIPWYILGSIANIVWIFSWHYGYFLTTVVAITTLLVTLIATQLVLKKNPAKSLTEQVIVHVPFNVYLGWVSVATIANIADVLSYYGFNGFGLNGTYWAAAMMFVAGLLSVLVTFTSENKAFGMVVIWALVGIVLKFQHEQIVVIAGIATLAIVLLSLAYKQFGVKKLKTK